MKIALLLSGYVRNFKHTLPYFEKYLFDLFDIDIYFYGYPSNDGTEADRQLFKKNNNIKNMCFNNYELIKDKIEYGHDIIFYNSVKRPETNVSACLSQYYNLYQCYELLDKNIKYDYIIRSRCDVFFYKKIEKQLFDIANEYIAIPETWDFKEVKPYAVSDVFAIGNHLDMKKYCNLYNDISRYVDEIRFFHPESLMGFHIMKHNIKRYKINPPHFYFEYPKELDFIKNKNRREY